MKDYDKWVTQDEAVQEFIMGEKDPNGLHIHDLGAKADQGKAPVEFITQFGPCLEEVSRLAEYGAVKYSREGWKHVLGGKERYTSAMLRHLFAEDRELIDPETDLHHATAVAWNALARLHFILMENTRVTD